MAAALGPEWQSLLQQSQDLVGQVGVGGDDGQQPEGEAADQKTPRRPI